MCLVPQTPSILPYLGCGMPYVFRVAIWPSHGHHDSKHHTLIQTGKGNGRGKGAVTEPSKGTPSGAL